VAPEKYLSLHLERRGALAFEEATKQWKPSEIEREVGMLGKGEELMKKGSGTGYIQCGWKISI